jgi:hypothetical protein
MAASRARFIREDDGQTFIGLLVEYEGKIWLVPEWLKGPTENILYPARIICTDGLSLTKAARDDHVDYLLATPLSRSVLEGRAAGQNLDVRERPDIQMREDQDFYRRG